MCLLNSLVLILLMAGNDGSNVDCVEFHIFVEDLAPCGDLDALATSCSARSYRIRGQTFLQQGSLMQCNP